MHTRPTGSVLMKEVSGEEDEVHFGISSDLEYLSEGVDGVLSTYGIFLGISDMVVSGEQDPEAAASHISAKEGLRR